MLINGKRLVIYFVIKDGYINENAVSDDMQLAFMNVMDWNLRPKWVQEKELSSIPNEKGNIFILEDFEDDFLEQFITCNSNARVIGPRCLLTCFMELISIPNTLSPIFNMAMNGLVVTTSLVPVPRKELIKKLVGYMGGHFTSNLTTNTTHVVVNSLLNSKYFIACEKGMSVMICDWVEDVWELNKKENVKATDYNIIKKYSCPIFHNLTITSSQLSEEEKLTIKKKIQTNGGTYLPDFIKNVTNILIIPFAKGNKHKFAVRWKVKCVQPEWIDECLKKGYAVPFENFIINSNSQVSSTPLRSVDSENITLIESHETEISVIPSHNEKNLINETESKLDILTMDKSLRVNEASIFKTPNKTYPKNSQRDKTSNCNASLENELSYKNVLNNIQIDEMKKCGPIFDGCKLYLAGFHSNEEEKLRKILNYGGALRFAELNESITHVIVGNPKDINLQQIDNISNKPHVVKLDWIANSIKQKSLAKESASVYLENHVEEHENTPNATDQPSPLSKKGYQILNPGQTARQENVSIPVIDHNLIEKYSQSQEDIRLKPSQERSTHTSLAPSEQPQSDISTNKLFAGLTFTVVGHDVKVTEVIKNAIMEYGGTIISSSRSVVDYTIVPISYNRTEVASKEIVTSLWLEDCFFDLKIAEVKYYHKPVTLESLITKPLKGCVITLSSYNPQEKQYLENLVKFLGARYQDVLSKKANAEKGVVPTTHLVCACPQGSKYDAAKKWNLPILRETWLCDCFKNRAMLPVENYLLNPLKENTQTLSMSAKKRENPNIKLIYDTSVTRPSASQGIQNGFNCDEAPNFRAAVTSTKIKDVIQNVDKCDKETNSLFKTDITSGNNVIPETPQVHDSLKQISNISLGNKTSRKNESSRITSKISNGPTSFLLEMNATNERFTSGVKRKSDNDHPFDRKHRSPKKKAIYLDKPSLTPVEEIGWQDTLTDLSHGIGESNNQENVQPIKRNIMISVDIDKKQRLEAIVKALGGEIFSSYESENDDSEKATHLVIDELKKTEKLLCSIASGLWIVHSSYLEESSRKNEFIKEDEFEWGNPLTSRFLVNASNECKLIATAAHRWRLTIRDGGPAKRPFVDMKAVIISPTMDGNVHSLMRVVKSGGGQNLPVKEILNCTHCLLKSNNLVSHIPNPLESLAEKRIHCLPAVYLKDYLIHDPPPDPKYCYISEYKRLFKS